MVSRRFFILSLIASILASMTLDPVMFLRAHRGVEDLGVGVGYSVTGGRVELPSHPLMVLLVLRGLSLIGGV